ncbi:hypothetical protein [Spongiactinospora sp. TRM90649]|uniref:hypothetical protein n=1 Tax=Spongiactinospora sp. TRM90649 TaxID=3031114 RepID=UPI0023F7CA04|nr:hypothetical protein [Spongiactinospora sp. TRM90649]MDF5751101.1 hypothetical protein [Spongiactinospora sp. TRM90649]
MPRPLDEAARQVAEKLQRQANGRWWVMWLPYRQALAAFFCGPSVNGLQVEAKDPRDLWQQMLAHDPRLWPAVPAEAGGGHSRGGPRPGPASTNRVVPGSRPGPRTNPPGPPDPEPGKNSP